jgi:hypothetical protein
MTMSSGPECQGGEGPDYDPVQLKLLLAAGYDISGIGGGVEFMDDRVEKVTDSPSMPAPEERLPVSLYFGERALHIASGDAFRPCFWMGTRRPGTNPVQNAKIRKTGTWEVLSNPDREYDAMDVRRWIADAGLADPDYYRAATRLRTWWRNGLKLLGRDLIVYKRVGSHGVASRANPKVDFTFSTEPLGDENMSRRSKY